MTETSRTESTWEIPERLRLELMAQLSGKPTYPARISYEEFLEWADEDTLAEWVDGEVVMTSPATRVHQDLVSFLDQVLGTYVRVHDLGVIQIAPFQMKLPGSSGREPDLIHVSTQHLGRFKRTYLDGPADAVVEITSRESERRDRGDKFTEYRDAAIPEYWLIDPEHRHADFFQLDPVRGYVAAETPEGIFRSRVLREFWLRVDWLWQDPLPDPTSVLLEIDREAYGRYLRERLAEAE